MPRIGADRLRERRDEILDGARAAFAALGYEGATVRVLEDRIGLSRGAIFHHYGNKDALFLAVAVRDAEQTVAVIASDGLVAALRAMVADPSSDRVGAQLEVARRVRTDPAFRARWQPHADRIARAVRDRLRRQQDLDAVRSDVDVERLAGYLELVHDGLLAHLAARQPAAQLDAVLDVVEGAVRARS